MKPPHQFHPPADDEDTAYDFPQRTVVSAAGMPPPVTKATRSVFDMAGAALAAQRLKTHGRFGDAAGFLPSPVVVRTEGVTRCTGSSYPANRWTDERHEQERQRRARQKPPKPTKKAKTRSKKLLELVGGDQDA